MTNDQSASNAFYLIVFSLVLALTIGGAVAWRKQARRLQAVNGTAPAAVEVYVVRRTEVDGAAYLLWSNGQITPDMAAHRKFVLRTIAAQALLESQAASRSSGN